MLVHSSFGWILDSIIDDGIAECCVDSFLGWMSRSQYYTSTVREAVILSEGKMT